MHGGYSRVMADGAAGGRPVLIVLQVRRFRCGNPGCTAVTFAEQAAGLSERYRRRSVPLLGMLAGFGLELAGRAAARLAGTLGIAVHPATVLRLVAAAAEPEVTAAPEVLGVDDFALAKGQVYGTVLVDMRTGDVIDLLPDREAASFEAWLTAHPGAGIICRDRAGNYAEGARAGAPDAIQVADRWHLWHNLAEYAEKTVAGHRGCLKDQPGDDDGNDAPGPADTLEQEPPGQRCRRAASPAGRIPGRVRPGAPPGDPHPGTLRRDPRTAGRRRIAVRDQPRHRTGPQDRAAVRPAGSAGELLGKATSRESKLDDFTLYLHQRWNEGVTDAAALHAELREQGWTGSEQTVRRYVRPFRQALAAPDPAPAVPKTRQITRWLLTRPDHLQAGEQAQLEAIRARCPHIDALAAHVTAFAEMMTARTGSRDLEAWLAAVEAADQSGLRSLAIGIRNDQQAVTNGLTLDWNSGKVEGTVNKIKMIKRQMYGRAGFDLLRIL